MEEQEYEIYDIITKQKIDKSQVKPGKSYIINYTKDKWKIRKVVFDENGRIKKEEYIRLEDRQEAIKETIVNILESKGNTDIQIDYNQTINLEEIAGGIEIGLPVYHVNYKDVQGQTKQRMLESQSLKDILTFDKDGNKHIVIKDAIIRDTTIQIGNSKRYDEQDNRNINPQRQSKESDTPTIVNWSNVEMDSDTFISKGNVIFNVNKEGKTVSYDLRTDEGVAGLNEYMESGKGEKNLNE